MKLNNYIALTLLAALSGCDQNDNSIAGPKQKIRLTVEVTPEDVDWYSLQWTDTLGQSGGYNLINRPEELQCVIRDQKQDTVGYYKGLSTPQSFTYFQTKDSIVTLSFSVRMNFFSDTLHSNKKVWDRYSQRDRLRNALEPVTINIKNDLRKKITVVLKEK